MAESEGHSDLPLAILKEIQNELKTISQRVVNLENKSSPPPSPRVSLTPQQEEEGDRDIEEEQEEGNIFQDSESETEELHFRARVYAPPVGAPVSENLAKQINDSFLLKPDAKALNDIHDNNPGPANITSFRVPALNQEVTLIENSSIWQKEESLTGAQKSIVTGLSLLSYLVADASKKKTPQSLTRQETFDKLNDCVSILVDAHKKLSDARRLNVKPILNETCQILCNKRAYDEIDSNRLLFGEDMDTQAENLRKRNRVAKNVQRRVSKNGGRGRSRGQGYRRQGQRRGNYRPQERLRSPPRDAGKRAQRRGQAQRKF